MANKGKLIGGFFSPEISRQLRIIAAQEDTTLQALLAQAIDDILVARGHAPCAVAWNVASNTAGNARKGRYGRCES